MKASFQIVVFCHWKQKVIKLWGQDLPGGEGMWILISSGWHGKCFALTDLVEAEK